MVYTREAHPAVGGRLTAPFVSGPIVPDAKSVVERGLAACKVARNFQIPFPTLVDDIANTTQTAYDTDPDRLFVVNKRGVLAYVGGIGPGGFHPDQVPPVLDRLLRGTKPG